MAVNLNAHGYMIVFSVFLTLMPHVDLVWVEGVRIYSGKRTYLYRPVLPVFF